jgi:serine/threonine protein kinase
MVKSAITGVLELYYISCKINILNSFICRLCGFPPFYDEDNMALFDKIKKGIFDFPSPSWDNISPDAINIIKNLLVVDPAKRMNPDELLKHHWIQGETTTKKGGDVLKKMREWNSKRKINTQPQ